MLGQYNDRFPSYCLFLDHLDHTPVVSPARGGSPPVCFRREVRAAPKQYFHHLRVRVWDLGEPAAPGGRVQRRFSDPRPDVYIGHPRQLFHDVRVVVPQGRKVQGCTPLAVPSRKMKRCSTVARHGLQARPRLDQHPDHLGVIAERRRPMQRGRVPEGGPIVDAVSAGNAPTYRRRIHRPPELLGRPTVTRGLDRSEPQRGHDCGPKDERQQQHSRAFSSGRQSCSFHAPAPRRTNAYATDSSGRRGAHSRSRSHSETATSANDAAHAQ